MFNDAHDDKFSSLINIGLLQMQFAVAYHHSNSRIIIYMHGLVAIVDITALLISVVIWRFHELGGMCMCSCVLNYWLCMHNLQVQTLKPGLHLTQSLVNL